MPEKPRSRSAILLTIGQVLLLSMTLLVPLAILREKSVTFDEVTHLSSGYSYWARGSIHYNQQHPPLIKEICALPLILMNVRGPEYFPENEWTYGQQFLFGVNPDADRVLFWGRLPAVFISAGLAALVLTWAGQLWGRMAGLLALSLYALDPTITAHSQFVTTDVGVAFFSVLYLFSLRSYCAQPSKPRLIASGLCLGMALAAKFSAVVLLPVTIFLRILASREQSLASRQTGGQTAHSHSKAYRSVRFVVSEMKWMGVMFGLACLFLWAIYFFPSDPFFYLNGIRSVHRDHSPQSYYYLMGLLRQEGWKSYFLVAWLVKTPIPSILLLAVSVGLFLQSKRKSLVEEAFLIAPTVSFFVFYSIFGKNIGVRYLIPCFPFLFIFAGRVAAHLRKRTHKLALAGLLTWNAAEYAAIMPDHLSYFNQIAGGSAYSVEWLDNSNVDWGQGLIQLRDYLQANQIQDYAFFYFGAGDPAHYGIRGRRITDFNFIVQPTYGIVILSAHGIPRARSILDNVFGNGPLNWLRHTKPLAIVGHAYYVYEIR